jgi:hypothetical protein
MVQCQCIKADGKTQCSRQAAANKPDKRFCWQHQSCYNIVGSTAVTKKQVSKKQITKKKQTPAQKKQQAAQQKQKVKKVQKKQQAAQKKQIAIPLPSPPAKKVWGDILDNYPTLKAFQEVGFAVVKLDKPYGAETFKYYQILCNGYKAGELAVSPIKNLEDALYKKLDALASQISYPCSKSK